MNRFTKFLKAIHISQFSFYLLLVLIILSFSITFYLLLPNNQLVKDPFKLQILLLSDVILVIILLSIIIRQVLLVFIYRKKNFNESRLYIKFVNLFTSMALGPAIGLVIITSLFFNLELRTWYGSAVKEAIISSNIVARDYENEIQSELISDTQLITREIIKVSNNNEVTKNAIDKTLREFINIRTISNIYLFDREGMVISSFNDDKLENFLNPNKEILSILDKNQVYVFQQENNSISAYKKINFLDDIYILVNRNLNDNIWSHIKNTRRAFQIYTSKEEESAGIQITFSMIFVLFSLCLILIAVSIGLNLAKKLSKPITNLIDSANEISKGNFDSKVSEDDQFDEIKILLTSYNQMINEIKNKQNLLISKSEEDETKRLFIEAILSLLMIGVISLDKNYNINLVNSSALKILNKKFEELMNNNFINVFPQWGEFISNFSQSKEVIENFRIEFSIGDNTRNLNFRIIKEIKENRISGYVVTIDDMTSLILAEKHAAWSDIARKIAHEVKNPLTPIKLSAERIEKKYKDKDFSLNDISKLTQTISNQVDDIGKLVDEFSSFARMPKAEIRMDNLSETIIESYNLFYNVNSKINMNIAKPKNDIFFNFDRFQLSQAFNNIIKNSIEAVNKIPNPSINLSFFQKDKKIYIIIVDNGVGVDDKNISKLFEPYYTTKEKGTGLGLSIVKKIIEDHRGSIKIEKNKDMAGTRTSLIFNI